MRLRTGWPALACRPASSAGRVACTRSMAGQRLTAAGYLSRRAVTCMAVGPVTATAPARPECGGTPGEWDRRRVAGTLVRLPGQRAGGTGLLQRSDGAGRSTAHGLSTSAL